jgi:hypothetical protein
LRDYDSVRDGWVVVMFQIGINLSIVLVRQELLKICFEDTMVDK